MAVLGMAGASGRDALLRVRGMSNRSRNAGASWDSPSLGHAAARPYRDTISSHASDFADRASCFASCGLDVFGQFFERVVENEADIADGDFHEGADFLVGEAFLEFEPQQFAFALVEGLEPEARVADGLHALQIFVGQGAPR